LHVKSITWYKDSHSLFDYESTKVVASSFDFDLKSKNISIYRKRDSKKLLLHLGSEVIAVEQS
jgi:hypothetical protein